MPSKAISPAKKWFELGILLSNLLEFDVVSLIIFSNKLLNCFLVFGIVVCCFLRYEKSFSNKWRELNL